MVHSAMNTSSSDQSSAQTPVGRQYRILVSGSRDWPDNEIGREAVYSTLFATAESLVPDGDLGIGGWPMMTLVHGAARGLDQLAADCGAYLGMKVEAHPADWEQYGKYAGFKRNIDMVALGADRALAFPIGESRGTRHCLQCIRKAGIPVRVIELPAGDAR